MLIDSPRLRSGDRERWDRASNLDMAWSRTEAFGRLVRQTEDRLAGWSAGKRGYVGVSWGKDSVVAAHLSDVIGWPLVWVRVEPIANPECRDVRDAFMRMFPHADYDEIVIEIAPAADGKYYAGGTLERGFATAAKRHGPCHVSGIRGAESAQRKRLQTGGGVTERTCAPLIHWSAPDVWAYLAANDLPIHPAYAMTSTGQCRDRLRVSSLGGLRGRGTGRAEWERVYYPEVAKWGRT